MDPIRAFRRDDIPGVARLWLRIFDERERRAPKALQDYFRDIFFDGPWVDPSLPSLVYEEQGLGIVGFIGVIPRRMTFNGQPVRVAVATQLMADERSRSYPAVKLMRRFLDGEQDLSFSDGANDLAEKLWRACGGSVALLYSLKWTRILRPAQYARRLLCVHGRTWTSALAAAALKPVCHALDALAARTEAGARWLPESSNLLIDRDPQDETLFWCVNHLSGERALRPEYDIESFRWLLTRAADKQMHGTLRKAVVREPGGQIAGWYLYYLDPGGVGQVLQFGARPASVRRVLNSLFQEARSQGAVAVSGELEPRFMKEIATSRCEFTWPGYAVLAQSRNPDLLNAVHRGDAFLTRLEGEWWARFSDRMWSLEEPPQDVQMRQIAEVAGTPG